MGLLDGSHTHRFRFGFDPSANLQTTCVSVAGGSIVQLYDGIYEVPSPNGELWGRKRFQEVFDAGKQQSLSETLASCFSAARMWQEAEHLPDDAAVVGLDLTGGQEGTVNG